MLESGRDATRLGGVSQSTTTPPRRNAMTPDDVHAYDLPRGLNSQGLSMILSKSRTRFTNQLFKLQCNSQTIYRSIRPWIEKGFFDLFSENDTL